MRAGGVGTVKSWWSVGVGLRDAVRGRLWPSARGSVGLAPGGRLRPAARRELRGGRVGRPRGGPSGRHTVGGGFGEARLRGSPAGRRGEASGQRLQRDRDGVVAARGRIGEKGPRAG